MTDESTSYKYYIMQADPRWALMSSELKPRSFPLREQDFFEVTLTTELIKCTKEVEARFCVVEDVSIAKPSERFAGDVPIIDVVGPLRWRYFLLDELPCLEDISPIEPYIPFIEHLGHALSFRLESAPDIERIKWCKLFDSYLLYELAVNHPDRVKRSSGRPPGPAYLDDKNEFSKKVVVAYEEYSTEYGEHPSQKELADMLCISESTFKRYLKYCEIPWPPV